MTAIEPQPSRSMSNVWNAFWFTPRDPTLLALMRVLAGLVTLYTLAVYGFTLETFHGEDALYSAPLRRQVARDRAVAISSLRGHASPAPAPANDFEAKYHDDYLKKWGQPPPGPYPKSPHEVESADKYIEQFGFDFRTLGLPFPTTPEQEHYVVEYTARYRVPPPPPYPPNREELQAALDFMDEHRADPRNLYARGTPIWSVFLDVTDPFWMNVFHGLFLASATCLVLGLGTRVTAPLTWFGNLCYIHRNPTVLFGVDTMMNVLLIYLSIGASGAALSLDRLIARWWKGREPGSAGSVDALEPSISTNIAVRMMQVHLCIIYFISGISKLQGMSWWSGTAVWNVLANYEFAPMQSELYCAVLRLLGKNQLIFEAFLTSAAYGTLAFEIAYPFLIWRPRTRWLFLAGAVFLHGFIGLFMGLKTFSLMMLIFNMAFLRPAEVDWLLSWLPRRRGPIIAAQPPP